MFDRESTLQIMRDLHKDAYGFRGNTNYSAMSDSELEAEYNHLVEASNESDREEQEREATAFRTWNERINKLETDNMIPRAVALRWDMEANESLDVSHYCYQMGIAYSHEEKIAKDLKGFASLNDEIEED